MKRFFFIIMIFGSCNLFAQDSTKVYYTSRITQPPKIDGVLDDEGWTKVNPVTDFIMSRPVEGGVPTMKSEVKIIYDDHAVYVGAQLYDNHPDSILHELGNRDDDGLNADFFRFVIDPYNLRQDAYDFGIYASGVQGDTKFSDYTFNAVWESSVKINDKGWSVEIKIPYSAIRFPKKSVQEWGLQITRTIRRTREFDQWTLTPSTAANAELFWGTLKGISNIETPVRLSLTPYLSTYFERSPDYINESEYQYSKTVSYNYGADVKYGIDDRFTLDMTLLPDFGQVQSDNKVKNLSYNETVYDENRTFFKEGTELFSKNGLFYSRRIGKTPQGFYSVPYLLNDGETIEENPSQVKLLNATKISGRTDNGLGIGLFNAVTDNAYAVVKDEAGNKRKILTEPLTNFNILVFDKQFKNNSDVWLINTNVSRKGTSDNANVTGAGFYIPDKKNSFAVDGAFNLSKRFSKIDSLKNSSAYDAGSRYFFGARKISGAIQYGLSQTRVNSNFDERDFGYFLVPNIEHDRFYISHNLFQPWKSFRDASSSFTIDYSRNPVTGERTQYQLNLDLYSTLLNYFSVFAGGGFTPLSCLDYNEPRVPGRYNKTIRFWYSYIGFSTDYRKKFAVDVNFNPSNFIGQFVAEGYESRIMLRYRFNDKFTLKYINNYHYDPFNFGVADPYSDPSKIIFGVRKLVTYENIITAKYIFKNDMALSLNTRHYWAVGSYRNYFTLLDNGDLEPNDDYQFNNNFSYNVFNIDLIYTWQFAPGSNISIAYKNAIETQTSKVTTHLPTDFRNTLDAPQLNSISIKLLYYLDFLYLKKR